MTTVALIADIHANALALESVLRACKARAVSAIWCAGDLVGYNAMPHETLALVRKRAIASVHGNHDMMVTGRTPGDDVGQRARRGVEWTRQQLSADELQWLASLPSTLSFGDQIICVHAALSDATTHAASPDEWRAQAERLRDFKPETRICICGHTHKASAIYVAPDGRVREDLGPRVSLDGNGIWFVNPGSVGEPRDGDPRASFAVLEWPPRHVNFYRAGYDRARLAKLNAVRMPPLSEPSIRKLTTWGKGAVSKPSMPPI